MTVLGRERLIQRIRSRNPIISPILSKAQIGAASVDLRMGNVVLMVRARGTSHVDPAAAKAAGPHIPFGLVPVNPTPLSPSTSSSWLGIPSIALKLF